jgi:cytohesin
LFYCGLQNFDLLFAFAGSRPSEHDIWRLMAAAIDEHHNAALQLLLTVDPALLGRKLCRERSARRLILDNLLVRAVMRGNSLATRALLAAGPASLVVAAVQACLPLHVAAEDGHVAVVEALLAADSGHGTLLARDARGRVPLHLAAIHGHVAVVEALLAADSGLGTLLAKAACFLPLHLAAIHGHVKVVEALLAADSGRATLLARDSKGELPLHLAAGHGHVAVAKALLAADSGHGTLLATDADGCLPLHHAAENGHAAVVEALLAADSGHGSLLATDANGRVPLHHAAGWLLLHHADKRRTAVAKALLAADSGHATLLARDADGCVPLHLAARYGYAAVVEALLAADSGNGTLLAKATDGWLPLHFAAWNGHTAVVEALLAADSDHGTVLVRDFDGDLPLHLAAFNGHVAVVEALLAVAPEAAMCANGKGSLPLHVAAEEGHAASVQALLSSNDLKAAACWFDLEGRLPLVVALSEDTAEHRQTARRLLHAAAGARLSDLSALLAAGPRGLPLLADFVIGHGPLSALEWQHIPTPCPGLLRAVPSALSRSADQARQAVQRLVPDEAAQLRTALLRLRRAKLSTGVSLPSEILPKILMHAFESDP